MADYTFDSLAKKYGDFRAPTAKVSVGGQEFTALNGGWWVSQVDCRTGVGMEAGLCSVTVGGVYDAKNSKFTCGEAFALGTPVTVSLGYVTVSEVFKGYLHTLEYSMDSESAPVAILHCMDVKGAMMGCGRFDYAGGATYKEVVNGFFSGKNARGYSVLCSAPAMSTAGLDTAVDFLPAEMDDYGFLVHTARRFGLEFFVGKGKLLLREKPAPSSAIIELTPAQGILSLRAELSSAGYLKQVTVKGASDDERDGEKKTAAGKAENSASIAADGTDAGKLIGSRKLECFDPQARDDTQAQTLAEARLRARGELAGEAEVTTIGIPELCAGGWVELGKLGGGLDGKLYITGVTHRLDDTRFRTTITARRNFK